MSLKGRLRRLAREAEGDGIVLHLKDGTTRSSTLWMFMRRCFSHRWISFRARRRGSIQTSSRQSGTPRRRVGEPSRSASGP